MAQWWSDHIEMLRDGAKLSRSQRNANLACARAAIEANASAMATHWIPAETALSLIANNSFESAARFALCKRAHEGLIRTKARLLVMGEKRGENVLVPTSFWWATGHEALDQDWTIGDFSTWIDRRIECRAFGVTFDLDGIREMLSPVESAKIARSLSVAGDNDWITANAARRFMYDDFGVSPTSAGTLLIDQCRLGFVAARAVEMRQYSDDMEIGNAREWDIPTWFWKEFTGENFASQNWERGRFSGLGHAPNGLCNMTLEGVHFAKSSMEAMLPAKPLDASAARAVTGGRPPAAFWDDLWCSICADINNGDLKTDRQTDIEKAMLDWTVARGHDLSPTGARSRARKLFTAIHGEDKNP